MTRRKAETAAGISSVTGRLGLRFNPARATRHHP
jgi:hypothetical protein